jgi:hypothetical protein
MYLLCKLLYISVFAVLSAAPPYLPLYYHDALGFSSDQIGFVLAIAPFIQTAACPLWTFVVDKRPKLHGAVMGTTALVGGIAVMGIMMIGHAIASSTYQLSNGTLVLVTSTFALTYAFFTLPSVSLVDSAVMKILGPNKILYGKQSKRLDLICTIGTNQIVGITRATTTVGICFVWTDDSSGGPIDLDD